MKHRIMVIEDCPETQQELFDLLHGSGYDVFITSDARRSLATVEDWAAQFDGVVVQEAIQGGSSLPLLCKLRTHPTELPVVVVTRIGDWDGYVRMLTAGAINYLNEPIDQHELLATLDAALQRPALAA